MTRSKFMNQLENNLKRLPPEELKDALAYYEEYFQEAGEENQEDVMDTLGSPNRLASSILADFSIKETENMQPSMKKGLSAIPMVILAVFASPIAIPLAMTAAAVIFALLLSISALYFSVALVGILFTVTGILFLPLSLRLLFVHIPTALFLFGVGLILSGVGVLTLVGIKKLSAYTINGLISLSKRMRKGGITHEQSA